MPLRLAEIWHGIAAEVGDGCGYHTVGQVAVAENEQAREDLAARARLMRDLGHDHEELIDSKTLKDLVPGIAQNVLGGLVVHKDGAASPVPCDPHVPGRRRRRKGCRSMNARR